MKIIVIDNYDSFVYNLVHYLQALNCEVTVVRNDRVRLPDIYSFDKILLSPGPGVPSEAGRMMQIIERFSQTKSILGVCLGHQAIAEAFGARLINLPKVYHGIAENLIVTDKTELLFKGVPEKFKAGRYHSWIVDKPLPECLSVTAVDEQGNIMALKHKKFNIRGVQFHPESIMTEYGKKIVKNWVK